MNKNYLLGGRIGDFLHTLVIPYFIYSKYGIKANIYLTDEGHPFLFGKEKAYNDLYNIIYKQKYINKFEIYNGTDHIDYDLTSFRKSPYIYKAGWNELLFNTYLPNEIIPYELKWLEGTYNFEKYNNSLIINRSLRIRMSNDTKHYYEYIIELYEKEGMDIFFVCYERDQYDNFELKDKAELILCPTYEMMINIIDSCSVYLGNQSSGFAIASALNKPRIVELWNSPDKNHYLEDNKYYLNMSCFLGD